MEGSLTLLFALLVAGLASALILFRALARLLSQHDASDPGRDLAE